MAGPLGGVDGAKPHNPPTGCRQPFFHLNPVCPPRPGGSNRDGLTHADFRSAPEEEFVTRPSQSDVVIGGSHIRQRSECKQVTDVAATGDRGYSKTGFPQLS